jgi:hypothetical protein
MLAIKLNNVDGNDTCAVCGASMHVPAGPALFLAPSWAPVCRECGDKQAPILAGMLREYERNMAAGMTESESF